MKKKLITIVLSVAVLIAAAFVQIGGTVGSRDMSGDSHARAAQVAEK